MWQEGIHMTGEVERLKREEAQAALEKKKAAEALMDEVHRSNAEQVCRYSVTKVYIVLLLCVYYASGAYRNYRN